MSNRDDFSEKVKRAVALRAGYLCSLAECRQLTVGPSEESAMDSTNIGVAAHIAAAAPGGPRYDPQQSAEERASIENAIWLCANHSNLIDRDAARFTRARLIELKLLHEKFVANQLAAPRAATDTFRGPPDLVAIGPRVLALGERVGSQGSTWRLKLNRFVRGDAAALTAFGEGFTALPAIDRFVVLNSDGDGRVLASAPTWRRGEGCIEVELVVEPRFPRTRAQDLGADLELVDGDLSPDFGLVSGLKRLPQHLEIVLGMIQGHEWFDPSMGSRISEYLALYGGTSWLPGMVKLEVTRLAAIPRLDKRTGREYTPFRCIERVVGVEILSASPSADRRLPVRVSLEVAGLSELWQRELRLYVGEYPPKETRPLSAMNTGPT